MEKFRNKYRIQSHRMPHWDYAGNGVYFITIVTQNRDCNLGNIVVGTGGFGGTGGFDGIGGFDETCDHPPQQNRPYMQYSHFGKIVNDEWLRSFEIRNELYLDEYIIMPNHLHAILIFNKPENEQCNGLHDAHVGTRDVRIGTRDAHDGTRDVETHGRASLPNTGKQHALIRKPQSISSFIAGFKSAVNSKIDNFIDNHNLNIPKYNRNNHFFQPNYYDHIIRNDSEYQRIKEYIITNPTKWKDDKFNPMNKKTGE